MGIAFILFLPHQVMDATLKISSTSNIMFMVVISWKVVTYLKIILSSNEMTIINWN